VYYFWAAVFTFPARQAYTRREAISFLSDETEGGISIVPEQLTKHTIDPEDVVAWLVTQPNANGTLYLEYVVRQYVSALRRAPAKLDIPVLLDVRNVFACKTPADLNAYWEIFRSASNYEQVNRSTSGQFASALNCYMRYLQHFTDSVHVTETIEVNEAQAEMEKAFVAPELQKYSEFLTVDFAHPERCTGCDPQTCVVEGKSFSGKNWRDVLVSLTEDFLQSKPKAMELYHTSLYPNGEREFLL